MKIDEFISKWKKTEPDSIFVKYNPQILLQRGVSEELKNQLSEYGLPESAAPYLNFKNIEDMSFLFRDYYYLGFTGNGDWICLSSKSGKILIVDHEIYGEEEDDDNYESDVEHSTEDTEDVCDDEDFEGIYLLNTSLEKLCNYLLVYRSFVEETLSDNVKNDCKEYGKLMLQLKKTLTQIDEKAMGDDGFWAMEISSLWEDR